MGPSWSKQELLFLLLWSDNLNFIWKTCINGRTDNCRSSPGNMNSLFIILTCMTGKSLSITFFLASLPGVYSQFTAIGQQEIVDAHNKLRSSLAKGTYVAKGTKQPSATNMKKMVKFFTKLKNCSDYRSGMLLLPLLLKTTPIRVPPVTRRDLVMERIYIGHGLLESHLLSIPMWNKLISWVARLYSIFREQ